jgi:hypothetical protein
MSFTTPIDIANRALQHCGVPRITAFTDSSRQAKETGFAIDKIRRSELRRSTWTFATRRAVMRPIVATTFGITFLAYNGATTYAAGDIVVDSAGFTWISLRSSNTGNTPGAGGVNPFWVAYYGPAVEQVWSSTTQYFPGDMIYTTGTPNVVYIAVAPSLNQAQPNATYWHVVAGAVSSAIVQIAPWGVQSPTGATTRNIYQMPYNFVRIAPQDPKAASNVRLNVTAGMMFNDWEIEAGYLFTNDNAPIVLRFVADQTDVTLMDDLFCETWAAHLGMEVCETLTQSREKAAEVAQKYALYLAMAKTTGSIEGGSTETEIPEAGAPPAQGQGGGR